MPVDMFLKIAEIPGESQDKAHKGEIEVYSYSWGLGQTASASGPGGGAGKSEFQDFSFTMPVSKASPKLFFACASGQHLTEATLTVRKAGETPLEFLVYKLTDCLVGSFQEAGSSGDDIPVDAFSLNFSKIEVSYKEQDGKGGLGAETTAGWDLKLNKQA